MKNFEQITATPEALGAFLAALPVADGPWDTEFRRVFCAACSAENCDGGNCPHSAERNNPLWWLMQDTEQKHKTELFQAITEAGPGMIVNLAEEEGHTGTASAAAAWKVLEVLGYVNERPFQETQDFLTKVGKILEILKQSGISPEYWDGVIGMAATFDVHMRG